MEMLLLPPYAVSKCRSFLSFAERLAWYLHHVQHRDGGCCDGGGETNSESSGLGDCNVKFKDDIALWPWFVDICRPSAFEIDTNLQDTSSDWEDAQAPIDVYKNLPLLRFVLSDEALTSIRFTKVSLSAALRRFERHHSESSGAARHSLEWDTVVVIMKYIQEIPRKDRASSYVILSKMDPNGASEALLDSFPVDAAQYPHESYHDLLVASCTAGHVPMVAELLEHGMSSQPEAQHQSLASAVRGNHLDVVQQLNAAGQTSSGGAAIVSGLRLGCTRGDIAMVDTLLAHYLRSTNAWDHHPMLLRSAVQSGDPQVLKLLLECDPRGAFIRLDQLIEHLAREMKRVNSHTPWLDAIVGKDGYAPWDLGALKGWTLANNDSALFDILVNHIEWNQEELDATLAAAKAIGNTHVASIISLMQQSIPDDNGELSSLQLSSVFASGDIVEARKRGRVTFSSAVIDRCWPNGTYDVRFTDTSEDAAKSGGGSDRMLSFTKVEKEVHPEMIRHRTARSRCRIDVLPQVTNSGERVVTEEMGWQEGILEGQAITVSLQEGSTRHHSVARSSSDNTQHAPQDISVSSKAENDIYMTTESPLSENDEDDNEIRADAALMGERELDLLPELRNLLRGSEEEETGAHEDPLTCSSSSKSDKTDSLVQLTLSVPSQQFQIDDKKELRRSRTYETSDSIECTLQDRSPGFSGVYSNAAFDGDGDDGKQACIETHDPAASILASPPDNASSTQLSSNLPTVDTTQESSIRSHISGECAAIESEWDGNNVIAESPSSKQSASQQLARRVPRASTAGNRTTKTSVARVVPVIPITAPTVATDTSVTRVGSLRSARPVTASARAPTLEKQTVSARRATKTNKSSSAAISWREVEEWKNVDLILSRKRRFLNALNGNIESSKVPWGEEFAAIQSLKRFATQHPDVLREHISSQLEEVGAASRTSGSQSARSQVVSSTAASHAREALLLVKDLSFLLKRRLAPFLDVILPAVLPAVFNTEKRFLCDIAYEVLEALVVHCSGRKLVLLLLQHGEECARRDDTRMRNLTSVYVEKCFATMNMAEIDAVMARSETAASVITALATLLAGKAAPSKIAAQKSLSAIHVALGDGTFERFVRAVLSEEKAEVVLRHTLFSSSSSSSSNTFGVDTGPRSPSRSPVKAMTTPVVVHQGMSILQRMVVQRQNRVVPT